MSDTLGKMDISFPNLGIYLSDVPKSFEVFGFSIALYGVIIAIGMLAGITLAAHIAKKTQQDPDFVWDISIWLIIVAIIGARLYYVIFFFDSYRDNLLEIFNLRNGGLAIYGGVIACVIFIFFYCKKRKVNTYRFLDTAAYGLVIGQIIGRWGNFFNREVFGGYTDGLLAMRIPIEMVRERDITAELAAHITSNYIQVHPTFLYESLWNVGLLILMFAILKHKKFDGEITLVYFFVYGAGRAWIEYIRTDQLYITGTHIPVSIVFSVVMMSVSLFLDIRERVLIKNGKINPDPWGCKEKASEIPETESETESSNQ